MVYAELFLGIGNKGSAVGGCNISAVDVLIVLSVDDVADIALIAIEVIGIIRNFDIHTGIEEHCGVLNLVPLVDDSVEGIIFDLYVLCRVDRDRVPLLVIRELTVGYRDILDGKGIARCYLTRSCYMNVGSVYIGKRIVQDSAMVEETTLNIDITRNGAFAPARLDRDEQTYSAYVLEGAVFNVDVGRFHKIAS